MGNLWDSTSEQQNFWMAVGQVLEIFGQVMGRQVIGQPLDVPASPHLCHADLAGCPRRLGGQTFPRYIIQTIQTHDWDLSQSRLSVFNL